MCRALSQGLGKHPVCAVCPICILVGKHGRIGQTSCILCQDMCGTKGRGVGRDRKTARKIAELEGDRREVETASFHASID